MNNIPIDTKSIPTTTDSIAGVPVSRLTSGPGISLLPYYTANARSADGEFVCYTQTPEGGATQAHITSLQTGESRQVSNVPEGLLMESVAFHPSRPLLFYGSENGVFMYDMETEKTTEVFRCAEGFRVKSEISAGKDHVIFWIYEWLSISDTPGSPKIIGFHLMRNCRSYVISVEIESGDITVVWGDTAPLTHPVINPKDQNTVLYANQGIRERLQELFTVPMKSRDNAHPCKLYHSVEQRPIYVGHSFFTFDGWVGTQLNEFGGQLPDGSYPDIIGFNAVIKPDGTCDHRARCPGGNKPCHTHAAYADSWWVGDTLPMEGACATHLLCIMKNNWETGFCQAEPLLAHGCDHKRPCHVHPRFTSDEKLILFNSNWGEGCQVYAAQVGEFFENWKDAATFEKRPARFCRLTTPPPAGPEF